MKKDKEFFNETEDTQALTNEEILAEEVLDKKAKKGQIHIIVPILFGITYLATIILFAFHLRLPCLICFIIQSFITAYILFHSNLSTDSGVDELMEVEEEIKIIESHQAEVKRLRDEITEKNIRIEQLESTAKNSEDEVSTLKSSVTELSAKLEESKDPYQSDKYVTLLPKTTEYDDGHPVIDIISLVNSVIKEFESAAASAGIKLQLSTASTSINVKAAPSRIRVLFRNIIDNSIKYMQQAGVLVITISSIGSDIFIVLKDNGQGLDKQETEHVFELNYQGTNRISGNGLGLTQSKAIVEYYGGTIYAKSSKNLGMAIYIQLPTTQI